ncbi:hypothetical protein GQ457_08G010150 [Hibiscus cannabinus]
MEQNVKQVMKLVEDDIEGHYQIKSEVIVQVQELRRIYQSLAERYDHLSGELRRSVPSDFQTQGPDGGLDQNSPMVTPDKKMSMHESVKQASSFSSDGGSYELSSKEGTESSSFSSDSDSESFSSPVNIYLSSAMDADNGVEHHKVIEKGSELPTKTEKIQVVDGENADGKSKMGELKERLAKCEEKLRNSNIKLESLQRDMKMREGDLESEKGKVLKLQKQIVELEVHVSESNHEALRLREELAGSKEKIQASDEEIAMLKHELRKKVSDDAQHVLGQLESAQEVATLKAQLDIEKRQVVNLQEQILMYKNDISNRGREVEELKVALCDAHDNFSTQKSSFQSEIFGLLEKENHLEARLEEWELYGRQLGEKLRQCETEKMGMKGQIIQLRAEVDEKAVHVEALNKDLDKVKLKYDMLMTEKDGVTAKVNTLAAEVRSRDSQIGQMGEHLQQLSREHEQLITASKHAKNVENELKLKIKDLEKNVDRQRKMILDVAEEKKEAIRQLSSTVEHYRSGYKEFQVFLKHKRHGIMAS